MQPERWIPVKGYESFYEVSDIGRVRSVAHVDVTPYFKNGRRIRARIRKTVILPTGYEQVQFRVTKIWKNFSVHRLVAIAFIPNPKNLAEVNHKDGNGLNNRLENLEWVTRSENHLHAYRVLGRKVPSEGKRTRPYRDCFCGTNFYTRRDTQQFCSRRCAGISVRRRTAA